MQPRVTLANENAHHPVLWYWDYLFRIIRRQSLQGSGANNTRKCSTRPSPILLKAIHIILDQMGITTLMATRATWV